MIPSKACFIYMQQLRCQFDRCTSSLHECIVFSLLYYVLVGGFVPKERCIQLGIQEQSTSILFFVIMTCEGARYYELHGGISFYFVWKFWLPFITEKTSVLSWTIHLILSSCYLAEHSQISRLNLS